MITRNDLVCVAVLSGNRNFEARIHRNLKANFLASPPLLVAYAIAGSVLKDLMTEPLGKYRDCKDIWVGDIWPTTAEIQSVLHLAMDPWVYAANYRKLTEPGDLWSKVSGSLGQVYNWPESSYFAEPPYFDEFTLARAAAGHKFCTLAHVHSGAGFAAGRCPTAAHRPPELSK